MIIIIIYAAMKLSNLLYTLTMAGCVSGNEEVAVECPCLSIEDLNRMPDAEIDIARSCKIDEQETHVEIWRT